MLTNRCLLLTVMFCAVFAAGGVAQTTSWTDGGSGPDWDVVLNWDSDVPDADTDAKHQTSASDCQVNIGSAECKSFTGKGGVVDRFLLIQASKMLTVVGDLKREGLQPAVGNFGVRLTNGVSGQLTTLDVGNDLIEIDLTPTHGVGQQAHWIDLDVGGNVLDSSITVGDNAKIDVVGDVSRTAWILGTSSADDMEVTTVTLESVGATTPNDTTWVVRGYADVSVTTDFIADSSSSVTIEDSAVMDVASDICDGSWLVQDDAEVTLLRSEHGEWTVLDNASVTSTSDFAPDELTVDDEGLVTFTGLGPSAAGGGSSLGI